MGSNSVADMVRKQRAKEYYPWYDSVVVGPGANDASSSWFNTFADFGQADRILWFRGNGRTVGESYSNMPNERLDFAYTIYGAQVDFFAPIGMARYDQDIIDSEVMPLMWLHDLPQRLSMKLKIAGTDELFTIPALKIPSGGGHFGVGAAAQPTTLIDGGLNGLPIAQNMWVAPEPFELPANQTLTVEGRVDAPLRGYLQALQLNPNNKVLPAGGPAGQLGQYTMPNWFAIRFLFHGAAHRQLRGARSAAGATGR